MSIACHTQVRHSREQIHTHTATHTTTHDDEGRQDAEHAHPVVPPAPGIGDGSRLLCHAGCSGQKDRSGWGWSAWASVVCAVSFMDVDVVVPVAGRPACVMDGCCWFEG